MQQTEKSREDKIRRMLLKEGYIIRKSRAKNTTDTNRGGYMIIETHYDRNRVVAGSRYELNLLDLESFAGKAPIDPKIRRKNITKSTLLSRGWNEKAIKTLLPSPLAVDNPHSDNAAPMLLWLEDAVSIAEETDVFKEYRAKKLKRSEAGKKTTEKKKQSLYDSVSNCEVSVEVMSPTDLQINVYDNLK